MHDFQVLIRHYSGDLASKLEGAVEEAMAAAIPDGAYYRVPGGEGSAQFQEAFKLLGYAEQSYRNKETWKMIDLGIDPLERIDPKLLPALQLTAHFQGLRLLNFAMPSQAECRRRWLGMEPPTLLERLVPAPSGSGPQVPLWRALWSCKHQCGRDENEFIQTLNLGAAERLELFAALSLEFYKLKWPSEATWVGLDDITSEHGEWAVAWARRIDAYDVATAQEDLCLFVHLALARSNTPVDETWQHFLPVRRLPENKFVACQEIFAALPVPLRDTRLTERIACGLWPIRTAQRFLSAFPSAPLAQYILDNYEKDGHLTRAEVMNDLKQVAQESEAVAQVLRGAPQEAAGTVLVAGRRWQPGKYDELTVTARKQLAKAGKLHGAEEYPLSERIPFFAADVKDARTVEQAEFLGQLTIQEINDAQGKLVYVAYLYMTDGGAVFRGKTQQVVAELVQGSLECSDPALHDALVRVLSTTGSTQATTAEPEL